MSLGNREKILSYQGKIEPLVSNIHVTGANLLQESVLPRIWKDLCQNREFYYQQEEQTDWTKVSYEIPCPFPGPDASKLFFLWKTLKIKLYARKSTKLEG